DSKYRFNHSLAGRIDGRTHFGLQFSSHAIHARSSFRQRSSRARLRTIPIRLAVGHDKALDLGAWFPAVSLAWLEKSTRGMGNDLSHHNILKLYRLCYG